MNRLEFQLKDKMRMFDELEENCPPGYTGMIELFTDLEHKTVDRYYARAYFKDGIFHNTKDEAFYQNYKDQQAYWYIIEGKSYGMCLFNYFEVICREEDEQEIGLIDGCHYINRKDVISIKKGKHGLNWIKFKVDGSIKKLPMFKFLVKILD